MSPVSPARLLRAAAAIAAIGAWPARPADAQGNGAVMARLNLSAAAPAVVPVQDLDFGDVVPATPATVNPRTAPNAGEFEISGTSGAEIAMSFALPTALVVGPNSMPIAFGPGAGCQVGSLSFLRFVCGAFNPAVTLVRRIPNVGPPFNVIYVWLGGTVSPTPAQAPGIYRGTITLTVAYTGN